MYFFLIKYSKRHLLISSSRCLIIILKIMKKREEEINKCILEYLITKKYTNSISPFMQDTGLKESDATTGNKLEKKWGTLLSLQKKISDLESEVKQLKEDLENGGNGLSDKAKKEAESMGLPKSVAKSTLKGHRQGITCLSFIPFIKDSHQVLMMQV